MTVAEEVEVPQVSSKYLDSVLIISHVATWFVPCHLREDKKEKRMALLEIKLQTY